MPPPSSRETERIGPGEPRCAVRIAAGERSAGARQIHHHLLGCRSTPGPRALLRANPRSGFPRSPAPRGRALRGGYLGEPCPGSPGSALTLCATCPRRLAQGRAFLTCGPSRLALSSRQRLRRHRQRPSPNTNLPTPESCPAEFLLIFA